MSTRHGAHHVGARTLRDNHAATARVLVQERDSLDIALYDQLIDDLARDVTDAVVRAVEAFAVETATRLSVARKPRGGVSILRLSRSATSADISGSVQ